MAHLNLMRSSLASASVLIMLGLNGLARPSSHLQSLEFPAHSQQKEPVAHKLDMALMRIWGVRNVTVGTLLVLIWGGGDEKLMAKALCAATALPVVDGFVSKGLTGGGVLQHWMVPPVLAVMAAGLHGWFD